MKRKPSATTTALLADLPARRIGAGALAAACLSMAACTSIDSMRKPALRAAFTIEAPLEEAYPVLLKNAQYCETPFAQGIRSAASASIVVRDQQNTGLEHEWVADLAALGENATQVELYSFSATDRRALPERFKTVVETRNFRLCEPSH